MHARGDGERVAAVVSAVAPPGARFETSESGETVTVRVETSVPLLPGLTLSASAVAAMEPGAGDG
ncbi:TadE family type IV pilus minor pilin [Tsukamurella sp. 8F]|uniref:TadE family type IV pilus minor pilin n=1 Tax=Tsukamurella sp. 8F TaxID=3031961 RepID=UPI0023B9044B|nr:MULTISPECIES: TadE family type IV pilus minor pilin [unclassified Tsukamurella]MDF0529578.1 TadE family type IV pilus minor pilin [Tsukamurella sp. 8J]MDF0585734.1 TadE family type IV pilus minor pilin [Tsukamurella sp. 8F]